MTKQMTPSKVAALYLKTIKLYVQKKWPEMSKRISEDFELDDKQYKLEEAWENVYAAVVIMHFLELDQVFDQDVAEAIRVAIQENLMHESNDHQVMLLNEFTVAASKAEKLCGKGILGISALLCEKIFRDPCDEFWIGFMIATLEEFGMWFWDALLEDREIVLSV